MALPFNVLSRIIYNKLLSKAKNQYISLIELGHHYNRSFAKDAQLNYDYLCNSRNTSNIKENIIARKSEGDIDKVISLWNQLKNSHNLSSTDCVSLENDLRDEARKIPNMASPHLYSYGEEPFISKTVNKKPKFKFKPKTFEQLMTNLKVFQMDHRLSLMAGSKGYLFYSNLAKLEKALIRYSVTTLMKKGFQLVSVPNLLYPTIIERCGMYTTGKRSQVYHINNLEENVCLSGTSEMSLGGYLSDRLFKEEELPLKLMAVSRCFREEVGRESADKGLFRVHEFNKVEMFIVTSNESGRESESSYKELVDLQVELFSPLNFHFQVLDMPIIELGAPAYCKTDIEAWIPGRESFGEISSASNCTDYQSRRMNIKYTAKDGVERFCHTLNGTACAVPRLMMALTTSSQTENGSVIIPDVLRRFMGGKDEIVKSKTFPKVKHFKGRSFKGRIVSLGDQIDACDL